VIADLAHAVITRPVNDLPETVRDLELSDDRVWHIDRHVIDVGGERDDDRIDPALLIDACVAAVALARHWITQASNLRSSTRLISKPFVTFDDEWLTGAADAPPPHVYICVARDEAAFAPVFHGGLVERASLGIPELDSRLIGQGQLFRLDGEYGEPGGWIFDLRD